MSVLSLFGDDPQDEDGLTGIFLVYTHTLKEEGYSKSPHCWDKIGEYPTLKEATAHADGEGTHTVVFHRGLLVYSNNKPPLSVP